MNKKLLFLSLISLATITSSLYPFFNFGFSVGDGCHPCPTPMLNLGFAAPLDPCGPYVGFNVGIPLQPIPRHRAAVVCHRVVRHCPIRDNEDCTFWEIVNETGMPITVESANESKRICPGSCKSLSHADSFKLTVRVHDEEYEEIRTVRRDRHYLVVRYTPRGIQVLPQ